MKQGELRADLSVTNLAGLSISTLILQDEQGEERVTLSDFGTLILLGC